MHREARPCWTPLGLTSGRLFMHHRLLGLYHSQTAGNLAVPNNETESTVISTVSGVCSSGLA